MKHSLKQVPSTRLDDNQARMTEDSGNAPMDLTLEV